MEMAAHMGDTFSFSFSPSPLPPLCPSSIRSPGGSKASCQALAASLVRDKTAGVTGPLGGDGEEGEMSPMNCAKQLSPSGRRQGRWREGRREGGTEGQEGRKRRLKEVAAGG